ncbi:hypothetical protein E2562_003152 [Oryza meyeriana var. granulata]|uniref:Uncharacterized protein n=1 Tax=Oryza meyeriana var. granulata TaxID=110450 RepID=A0A6G1EUM2_9ORYZ|nr:hypothetical protein E2562_003152 [Oryza meyeriana var. granulata]
MGNCQAADAAAVVIQHPSSGGGGRVERAYGAVSAAAVMAANPGHYVAAVVPVAAPAARTTAPAVRRRLKLLRPDDTLVLGGVYRLVSFEGYSFYMLLALLRCRHGSMAMIFSSCARADVLKQFVSKRNATVSRATIAATDEDEGHRRRDGGEAPEPGSMRPAKVAAHSHKEDPSSPSSADEPRPEPEYTAAAMALGGRMSLSRHGQWRPALPSIAEGSVVC